MLFEQAKKLGLDFGDLEEYGFEINSSAYGASTCLSAKIFKDMDDALSKSNKFRTKIVSCGGSIYNKATCHPFMQ